MEDYLNSKRRYISLSNKNIMVTTHEGVDALYALTMHLPADESKLGKPTFWK